MSADRKPTMPAKGQLLIGLSTMRSDENGSVMKTQLSFPSLPMRASLVESRPLEGGGDGTEDKESSTDDIIHEKEVNNVDSSSGLAAMLRQSLGILERGGELSHLVFVQTKEALAKYGASIQHHDQPEPRPVDEI